MYDLPRYIRILSELKKLIQQNRYSEALQVLNVELRVVELILEAEIRTGNIATIKLQEPKE